MELALSNGNYVVGDFHELTALSETDELAQRIQTKLKVRKGTFLPLPKYGSRLYLLQQTKPSERLSAARQYVLEALAEETDLELNTLNLAEDTEGNLRLDLKFTYKGEYAVDFETGI